ncbi:MAG: hypothetical protein GY856_52195, partial [bacterium]|nr:hypothetical protein [bacterium]
MKRTVGWLTTMTLAVLALTSCGDAPPGQITDSGSCETGSLNCGCYGNETCDLNLTCVDGQCIDERVPPANPKCYTPCKRGAVLDGIYRVCEEDGLMEGCIGGAMCVDGTCILPTPFAGEIGDGGVADGGVDDGCTTDEDCPGFQTCIQSNCYSDCEIDEDCSEGDGCYLRVCRPLCEFENTACPAKSYCATAD